MGVPEMSIKEAAYVLAIISIMMNASLLMAGSYGFAFGITLDEFTQTYPDIPGGYNIGDDNSDFQQDLQLENDQGDPISDITSIANSFLTATLDFLSTIPIVGPFIPLFRFALSIFINLPFGITFAAIKIGLPLPIIKFVGLLNWIVVTFAALELIKDILGVLGLGK